MFVVQYLAAIISSADSQQRYACVNIYKFSATCNLVYIQQPLYITHLFMFTFKHTSRKLSDISRVFSAYNLARVKVTTIRGNKFQLGDKNNSHFKNIKK